jgi:hypothetical protein
MKNKFYFFILIQILNSISSAQTCNEWFNTLNINSNNKKCLSICNTSETDMATFGCHNECEKLCTPKPQIKCNLDSKKIKIGKIPSNWPWAGHKPLSLTTQELNFVNSQIAEVSPELLRILDGIYFFEKPKDLFSIGTDTSYFENQIIIYKKAIDKKSDLTTKIIHELGHGLHENSEKLAFTEYSKIYFTKNRKYLTVDSKFSPEEDFATNFEIYITNPALLKKEIPMIFNWFSKKYADKFNSRKCDL